MDLDLDSHYDVCINGSGLVESILACAITKCGYKVLHLDSSDNYGRYFSAYNYQNFVELGKNPYFSPSDADSTEAPTHEGNFGPNNKFIYVLGRGSGSDSQSMKTSSSSPFSISYDECVKSYRAFNIDLTIKLLLCSGDSVECFIQSGVSRYLEFKSIEKLYYQSTHKEMLLVPCSKKDVFNTKLLTIIEKRILTKFLSFADDYGREINGTSIVTLNEKNLAQGRSLYRPQNKDFNSCGYALSNYENRPFIEFMEYCKIPLKLQTIIIHTLCLEMRNPTKSSNVNSSGENGACDQNIYLSTSVALLKLATFLNSMGIYGDTALLIPLYGTSEVVQAFCRMAAVWGATYILRRSIHDCHTKVSVQLVEPDTLQESTVSSLPTQLGPVPGPAVLPFSAQSESVPASSMLSFSAPPEPVSGLSRPFTQPVFTPKPSALPLSTQPESGILIAATTEERVETLQPEASFSGTTVEESEEELTQTSLHQYRRPALPANHTITDSNGQKFSCHLVVSAVEDFPSCFLVPTCLLTRVSVFANPLLTGSRTLLVIPPFTNGLNNPHSINVLQQDDSVMVCSQNRFIVSVVTQVDCTTKVIYDNRNERSVESLSINDMTNWNDYVTTYQRSWNDMLAGVIEMLVRNSASQNSLALHTTNNDMESSSKTALTVQSSYSDESEKLGPVPATYSTVIEGDVSGELNTETETSVDAHSSLQAADQSQGDPFEKGNQKEEGAFEIYYTNFVRPLYIYQDKFNSIAPINSILPPYIALVGDTTSPSYHVCYDEQIQQAKHIFQHYFPNDEFMATKDSNAYEEEESQQLQDEEAQYLKSMIPTETDNITKSIVVDTHTVLEVTYVNMVPRKD